jgi:xylulokinase
MRVPGVVHAAKGKYLLMPWCETAGMALKWYRDQFFSPWVTYSEEERRNLYDRITAEAAEAPIGSGGVIILPYFAGSGSPDFNPNAKAVIFGLTMTHQRKHISRALLESVAYMLKQNLDVLKTMGVTMNRIISSGGGSKSPLWCQIKADVTGLPVTANDIPDATARGAAKLALESLGLTPVDSDSVTTGGNVSQVFAPNHDAYEIYQQAFNRFLQLGGCLQPLF